MVDLYGYNEKMVARMKVPGISTIADFRRYAPGHVKMDIDYVLIRYKPDVFFFPPIVPDGFWQSRGYDKTEFGAWHKSMMFPET